MIASLILACYLIGWITAQSAAVFLLVAGIVLIASEALFTSGLIAFSGLLSLYVAYALAYGQARVLGGLPLGWSVFFGIALAELALLGIFIFLFVRHRRLKTTTGVESMIGHAAEIVEWSGRQGRVRIQGETWKAEADQALGLQPGDKVTVAAVDHLILKIRS